MASIPNNIERCAADITYYQKVLEIDTITPDLKKHYSEIVYELFLQKFNPESCPPEQTEQYKLIHEYATELKQNGWVKLS